MVDSHLHGRVYLLVRPGTADPLSSVSATGSTLVFGKDISDVAPGQSISLSGGGDGFEGVYGYPKTSLDDLASGQYTVRAFFNVYETAHRSDGSTVDVHFPCGDGGRPFSSPGNLRSAMQTVTIDRNADTSLALTLSEKLTPAQAVPAGGTCQQGNPAESAHVKQVKIKSERAEQVLGPRHVRRRHGPAAVGLRRRGQRGQALSRSSTRRATTRRRFPSASARRRPPASQAGGATPPIRR